MTVTVKGCLACELVLDTARYPKLDELLRGIVTSEFLGEKPGPAGNGKRRGRPPKQESIPEEVSAPAENDNAGNGKRRGRPPKQQSITEEVSAPAENDNNIPV
jgi:hypothetical protein